MEDKQRSALRAAVVKARRLLEKDFQEQLEGTYNILPDGRVLESAPGDPIVRARLLGLVQHHRAGGATAPEAVDRVVREAAFTVLNRFAALKMAERRHLVRECVSQGVQSVGIRELAECAPGLGGASEDAGYRLLLEAVMDEISLDLKVLFYRRDSIAPLWPGPNALDDLLKALNDPQLADVWADDTTIGWVYQEFNDNDVREMRDAAKGGAPRNSRELAVRNQFFTPRYVVEFLTDNTLGRLWYEMTYGETSLRDRCRYLIRRPGEIFSNAGESAPARTTIRKTGAGEDSSQKELLQQPVHIPHRPLKDPRDIRLLDPACGSMHFGLYAFELFTVIYDEAWDIASGPDDGTKSAETFASFVTFAATFPDKASFLREVPRLTVERNIHGIDIDPRATQIAGLSLWLRAQRAWHEAGVRPADRRIRRSNLVCAEPMPGDKELLREFVEQEFPAGERPVFALLLDKIFDRMTLAGEAGPLLRIEQEIRSDIADAKRLWKEGPKAEQASLFAGPGEKAGQGERRLDLSGITDEQFWERAEQRIYDALEAYAEHAENGSGFQRRLFAADAAQGFAFIDLCRKRYDVVVMNPPFGLPTAAVEEYAKERFEKTWQDIYALFFERTLQFTKDSAGTVGAITPKSFYHAKGFRGLRNLLREAALLTYSIDIGGGVLDAAVDVCFSILESRRATTETMALFCNLVPIEKSVLAEKVIEFVHHVCNGEPSRELVPVFVGKDAGLPNEMLPYRFPAELLQLLRSFSSFEASSGNSVVGITTFDNDRFIRLSWETSEASRHRKEWLPVAMGGGWDPFYGEFNLVVKWRQDAAEMRANELRRYGTTARTMQSQRYWFRPGLTFSKISKAFSTQPFPAGSIFTSVGFCIFSSRFDHWTWLGYFNSKPVCCLMSLFSADRHWHSNSVASLPVPTVMSANVSRLGKEAFLISAQLLGQASETAPEFLHCVAEANYEEKSRDYQKVTGELANEVSASLRLSESTLEFLSANAIYADREFSVPSIEFARRRFSYFIGVAFGRWDIRFATGGRPAPELRDPFAPLPICPPGMLQGDDGLPLSPEAGRQLRAQGRYPLDVAWDGILVDDPEHPLDLERRVRAALAVLWGDRADALEQEACALLGVPSLGEWFRRPAGFFADHLKRYSKSRRQAPIYWPLSTASGSYTIWVHYHRLTADTLFQLAEYVELKLGKTREERLRAAAEHAKSEGREAAKLAKHGGELVALEQELEEMKAELLRVAALPYRPDLNDGVQITAAPLWKLFRLSKWCKDLEATWKSLEKGEYDWAHLAYAIWPDRVRERCKTDRSLAIAHGLEEVCNVEIAPAKKQRKKSSK